MRCASLVFALLAAHAAAQPIEPCTFVVAHGSLAGDPSRSMQAVRPDWFVVTGRAEVSIKGTTLRARLFDGRAPDSLSHEFTAKLSEAPNKAVPFRARAQAILRTLNTDSGEDVLSGSFSVAASKSGEDRYVHRSLVVHSAFSFVGVHCYAKSAV